MIFAIDLDDVTTLKADLRGALPEVPSAHRVEALARGLGFNTNAALRAALREKPQFLGPQDTDFYQYLKDHGFTVDSRVLRRAIARLAIRRAMAVDERLTTQGYGVAWRLYKTLAEGREALISSREDLLSDWSADQFELASIYLSQLERRKSLNRDYSTYNLKHQAKRLSRDRGLFTHLGNYVCNGILIAAAMAAGFQVRQIHWDSLNGFVNATTRSIKAARTGQLIDRSTMSALLGFVLQADQADATFAAA